MSLEECRRLAEEKWGKARELGMEMRRARGMVDGEVLWLCLSRNPFDWPRKNWAVFVSAYGELSTKYFNEKVLAEEYFEDLARKHGLEEEK